jgi:NADPH:quinone reductase-like Zn-dependent oxidoreductase
VLDYRNPGWQNKVKEITGGKGVDVRFLLIYYKAPLEYTFF